MKTTATPKRGPFGDKPVTGIFLAEYNSGSFDFTAIGTTSKAAIDALLRALVAPQPIVILDEPTGELDRLVADRVWDCLFASAEGKLLICATHDTQILDRFDHVLEVTDHEVRLSAG